MILSNLLFKLNNDLYFLILMKINLNKLFIFFLKIRFLNNFFCSYTIKIAFCLLFVNLSYAQSVIVSSGSSESNQYSIVDYSIGQIFFQSFPKSDYTGLGTTYKEGVHQIYYVDASVRSLNFDVTTKAYPNPTKNIINISLDIDVDDFSGLTYSIFTQQGQFIGEGSAKNNPFSIDISGFSTGVYFIYINGNKMITKLIKVIKE